MAKQVFISPSDEGWKVKTVGAERAAAILETKVEAVKKGIEIAKNSQAELLVQKLDGTIGWRNSYGNDPCRSKG